MSTRELVSIKTMLASGAVILGMVGALVLGTSLTPDSSAAQSTTHRSDQADTAQGVTAQASDEGNEGGLPELIAVQATNGKSGYIKNSELQAASGGNVSSPEEAIEWTKYVETNPRIAIPVYDADGKTVIGEYVLANTTSEENVPED